MSLFDIKEVSYNVFKEEHNDNEGLVLLGCGGDPNEWIDGVHKLFYKEGALLKENPNDVWSNFYKLETTGGRVDLVMMFTDENNNERINLGKLALLRLAFGSTSWVSDYFVNYEKHHVVGVDS